MCRVGTYANFDVVLIKCPDNNRRIVIRTKVRSISSISIFAERNWEYITYIILNIYPLSNALSQCTSESYWWCH